MLPGDQIFDRQEQHEGIFVGVGTAPEQFKNMAFFWIQSQHGLHGRSKSDTALHVQVLRAADEFKPVSEVLRSVLEDPRCMLFQSQASAWYITTNPQLHIRTGLEYDSELVKIIWGLGSIIEILPFTSIKCKEGGTRVRMADGSGWCTLTTSTGIAHIKPATASESPKPRHDCFHAALWLALNPSVQTVHFSQPESQSDSTIISVIDPTILSVMVHFLTSSVTMLDLSNNKIGDPGIVVLTDALCHSNVMLTELNVANNDIADQGAITLAHYCAQNSVLHTLIVDRNQVGSKGASHLAEVVKTLKTIKRLQFNCTDASLDFITVLHRVREFA